MTRRFIALAILLALIRASLVGAIDPSFINHPYYKNQDINCQAGGSTITSSPGIPADWQQVMTAAGQAYSVDPKIIAAIFYTEHNATWQPFTTKKWAVSSAGAAGPFQIIPSTFTANEVDGNKDGIFDVNNPYDATFTAAKILGLLGATASGMPAGGYAQSQGFKPAARETPLTVASIAARYNQGGAAWRDDSQPNYLDGTAAVVNAVWRPNPGATYHAQVYGYINISTKIYSDLGGTTGASTVTECLSADQSAYANLDNLVYYSQRFPPYNSQPYGSDTIGSTGCGVTSMAMIVATLTGDKSVNPATMAVFAVNSGDKISGGGTSWGLWSDAVKQWNLQYKDLSNDISAVIAELQAGKLVIVSFPAGSYVGPPGLGFQTNGGHLAVIRAVTADGKLLLADPNDSYYLQTGDKYLLESRTPIDQSQMTANAQHYWSFWK